MEDKQLMDNFYIVATFSNQPGSHLKSGRGGDPLILTTCSNRAHLQLNAKMVILNILALNVPAM